MMKTLQRIATVARFTNGGHRRAGARAVTLALTLIAGVAPFLITLTALAQVTPARFDGRWIRVWPAGLARGGGATILLTVTATDQTLVVDEQSGSDTPHRSQKSYRLDKAWDPRAPESRGARAFRWLAADRVELRDVLLRPGNPTPMPIGEVWVLSADGSTLQIQRRLPTLGDFATEKTSSLVFRRTAP